MKERFEGDQGAALLKSAVMSNQLVEQNEGLATLIIKHGTLVAFSPTDKLIEQDGTDNDLYLLVCGEVDIFVNGRPVAIRKAGEPVGEMALINPCAVRSATVAARTDVVTLKVTEPEFRKVSEQYKELWKPLALIAGERLRQRNQFHKSPNEKPKIFIGSSSEGLEIAKALRDSFPDSVIPQLWSEEFFGPSSVTIDRLLAEVDDSDFAVFLFSPDDASIVRGNHYFTPRDNVVFEFGLFMGLLKRERTFMVVDKTKEVKIPSDYNGITYLPITFKSSSKLSKRLAKFVPAIARNQSDSLKKAAETVRDKLMLEIIRQKPR